MLPEGTAAPAGWIYVGSFQQVLTLPPPAGRGRGAGGGNPPGPRAVRVTLDMYHKP